MENSIKLSEIIFKSINELLSSLLSSIDNSIYSFLDDLAFIDTSILSNKYFEKIFGSNSADGILLICNSLILGFIIYYAIAFLISHLTYSKIDTPKQFVFKAIIFIIIMNSSLWICEQVIFIISIITKVILSIGQSLFSTDISFSNFINNINKTIYFSGELNLFSFNGIIKTFTSFGLINLILTYSLRYIMVQIFILISPFAFLSLVSNSTDWFFKVWIKTFLSLLFVQILIALILLLSFSIPLANSSNFDSILFIGIIYALTKANGYMKELFGGISTTINSNLTSIFNN